MCKEALIYEWCEGEQYTQRIRDFLNDIDECMIPRLSQRVNIKEYSHKLARNAHTLFADFGGEDIGACSIYCFYFINCREEKLYKLWSGNRTLEKIYRISTTLCLQESCIECLLYKSSCT